MDTAPKNKTVLPVVDETVDEKCPIYDKYNTCLADVESGNYSPDIEYNKDGEIIINGIVAHIQDLELQKFVRTPSFKKWFGESRIVFPDTLEPIPVFHGIEEDGIGSKSLYDNSIKNGPNLKPKATKEDYGGNHLREIIYFTSHVRDSIKWSIVAGNKKGRITSFPAFLRITKPETFERHKDLIRAFNNREWEKVMRSERDGVIQWSGLNYDTGPVENSDQFAVFGLDNVMWIPTTLLVEREKREDLSGENI
jgi:hypothetical protein